MKRCYEALRRDQIINKGCKVLRYKTGSFSHSLIREILIYHNISYSCVLQCRVSTINDHWALVVRPDTKNLPFKDEPVFN